jgi:hypothetical protein
MFTVRSNLEGRRQPWTKKTRTNNNFSSRILDGREANSASYDAPALQKGFANGLDTIRTKANSGPRSEQAD